MVIPDHLDLFTVTDGERTWQQQQLPVETRFNGPFDSRFIWGGRTVYHYSPIE